jgi:predicted molibdopterin-dependent oxidoreductase YjgC
VTVEIDGEPAAAFAGETVATVLLAQGRQVFRQTERKGAPRGVYCGMGVCYDCLVTIDGVENVRACVTPVAEGMVIETFCESSAASSSKRSPPTRRKQSAAAGGHTHD